MKRSNYRRVSGGYIGLVALLVSVAIIGFLFIKVYLTPRVMTSDEAAIMPHNASATLERTEIEQMHADVDAAKAVQERLNQHNTETNAVLGE